MAISVFVTCKGDVKAKLGEAKELARQKKIAFIGDDKGGIIDGGGFAGTYSVAGQDVEITITKKPFFAPASLVESSIKKFFA